MYHRANPRSSLTLPDLPQNRYVNGAAPGTPPALSPPLPLDTPVPSSTGAGPSGLGRSTGGAPQQGAGPGGYFSANAILPPDGSFNAQEDLFGFDDGDDDAGTLGPLEKIYLYARSRAVFHRVFIARSLPQFLAEISPPEAVKYVLPLLNGLGTDPDETVREAFVAELVPIIWWFLVNCELVDYLDENDYDEEGNYLGPSQEYNTEGIEGEVDEDGAMSSKFLVSTFTPLLGSLLLSSNALVSEAARNATVDLLGKVRREEDIIAAGMSEESRALIEKEIIEGIVIALARLDYEPEEGDEYGADGQEQYDQYGERLQNDDQHSENAVRTVVELPSPPALSSASPSSVSPRQGDPPQHININNTSDRVATPWHSATTTPAATSSPQPNPLDRNLEFLAPTSSFVSESSPSSSQSGSSSSSSASSSTSTITPNPDSTLPTSQTSLSPAQTSSPTSILLPPKLTRPSANPYTGPSTTVPVNPSILNLITPPDTDLSPSSTDSSGSVNSAFAPSLASSATTMSHSNSGSSGASISSSHSSRESSFSAGSSTARGSNVSINPFEDELSRENLARGLGSSGFNQESISDQKTPRPSLNPFDDVNMVRPPSENHWTSTPRSRLDNVVPTSTGATVAPATDYIAHVVGQGKPAGIPNVNVSGYDDLATPRAGVVPTAAEAAVAAGMPVSPPSGSVFKSKAAATSPPGGVIVPDASVAAAVNAGILPADVVVSSTNIGSGNASPPIDAVTAADVADPEVVDEAAAARVASMSLIAAVTASGFLPDDAQGMFIAEVARVGSDPIYWVRREATFALGALTKVVDREMLLEYLVPMYESFIYDNAWQVRYSALFALPPILLRMDPVHRRSFALEQFQILTQDKSRSVRCGMLECLGEVIHTFASDRGGPPRELIGVFIGAAPSGYRLPTQPSLPPPNPLPEPIARTNRTLSKHGRGLLAKDPPKHPPTPPIDPETSGIDPAIDTDRPLICAFNFPAVALTLGRARWPEVRAYYAALTRQARGADGTKAVPRVRRTLAASLGEMARILGPDISRESLVPVFWDALHARAPPPANAAFGGFVSNFGVAADVAVLHGVGLAFTSGQREAEDTRVKVLECLVLFVAQLAHRERVSIARGLEAGWREHVRGWREREVFARTFGGLSPLFNAARCPDVIRTLVGLAIADNVAAVREEAIKQLPECFRGLGLDSTTVQAIRADLLGLVTASSYRRRATFVSCMQSLVLSDLGPDEVQVDSLWKALKILAKDPITDVRIGVARLVSLIAYRHFPEYNYPPTLISLVRTLRNDSVVEVWSFVQFLNITMVMPAPTSFVLPLLNTPSSPYATFSKPPFFGDPHVPFIEEDGDDEDQVVYVPPPPSREPIDGSSSSTSLRVGSKRSRASEPSLRSPTITPQPTGEDVPASAGPRPTLYRAWSF